MNHSLTIKPAGEIHSWTFQSGHYCGDVEDSVSVTRNRTGCVISRQDVRNLRMFLQEVVGTWKQNPKTFHDILNSIYKGKEIPIQKCLQLNPKFVAYHKRLNLFTDLLGIN